MTTTRRYDSGLLTDDELAAATKLIGHAETTLTDDEHVQHLKDMHVSESKLANAELAVEVFSPLQTPGNKQGSPLRSLGSRRGHATFASRRASGRPLTRRRLMTEPDVVIARSRRRRPPRNDGGGLFS